MLSTQEEIYIRGLIENYYDNGYKNYICITNNPQASYNQSYYDIVCYYSPIKIEKENNIYTIPHNSYRCQIDTKNPTSTNKLDSLNCTRWEGDVEPNQKEFIYSNIEYHSNLIEQYEYQKFFNITIVVLLCMILVYIWLKTLFKSRRDINE